MSTGSPMQPEYEFNIHQTDAIGGLAYRMSGVGFVFKLVGILLIAYAISVYISKPDTSRVEQALEKAGVPMDKAREHLKEQFKPVALLTTSLAVSAVGLILLLIGVWTRNASTSFNAIVNTRGQDVSRLMEAIKSLKKTYGMTYNLMLLATLILVGAVGMSVYHAVIK